MSELTRSVTELIDEFAKMPGIGKKSAERLAYYILRISRGEALALADAIRNVKENVRYCRNCYNLAEEEECEICRDPRREQDLLCVVEQPRDLMALEQSGTYRGLYHVLLGADRPAGRDRPGAVDHRRPGRAGPRRDVQGSDHGHQPDGRGRRHGPAHFQPAAGFSACGSPGWRVELPRAAC